MSSLEQTAYRAFLEFMAAQRVATVQGETARSQNWRALPDAVRQRIARDSEGFFNEVETLANLMNTETETK